MSPIGQGYCGGAEWGIDGKHICTVRAEQRREREEFYTVELPYLFWKIPGMMIWGRDFNCVLAHADCTGKVNFSRALQELVRGYDLLDV
jgi:hypothetical protein